MLELSAIVHSAWELFLHLSPTELIALLCAVLPATYATRTCFQQMVNVQEEEEEASPEEGGDKLSKEESAVVANMAREIASLRAEVRSLSASVSSSGAMEQSGARVAVEHKHAASSPPPPRPCVAPPLIAKDLLRATAGSGWQASPNAANGLECVGGARYWRTVHIQSAAANASQHTA